VGIFFTQFVASKMALLHKLWKLKASLRPASFYKGEFLPGGRIMYVFDEETSSSLISRPEVSSSVTAAVGHSNPHRSFGSSFTAKSFSSSRSPAAGRNPSTIFSTQRQALLSTEALSGVFASSNRPLLENFGHSSVKVATDFRGSNVGKLSEAGLYLLMGQTLGVFSQTERTIVPKQGVDFKIPGLQHVRNEHILCDMQTQMDTDGVVEACKYKPEVFTSVDSRTFVIQGIDGFCEACEDSEVDKFAVGGYIYVQNMILENVSMQGCLDVQRVSSLSIGHYSFEPVSLLSVAEDSPGSFAGKESSGLEFNGYHELGYSEDLSRNSDK